jgi:alpha-D-ribose 1-methylphosphonate 5-triphosphate diphosphatase
MTDGEELVRLAGVAKSFTLHLRGAVSIEVVERVEFAARKGECVVLAGPSGAGKSSILKMIYGNYRCDRGAILVRDGAEMVDVASAAPRRLLQLRRSVIGYVSQFLRVIPRIGAFDIVVAAAVEGGCAAAEARDRAARLLTRLHVPEQLWTLPPSTFSGGEQQRVNIARGLAADRAVLLLDEPTASLDAANRAVVVDLVRERTRAGAAVIGIFHDDDVRDRVADRVIDVTRFAENKAALCVARKTDMSDDSLVLTNARLILADRVIENGWLAVDSGRIAGIGEDAAPEPGLDLGGDTVIPGLIELHTDHLESHYAPRPHVRWHALSAVMAYDAQIAAAGITTVFDSLRVGSDADATEVGKDLATLAEAIAAARATGHLRADHLTHLRCEIASPDVIEQAEGYAARHPIDMMSLMDHTPGQRQFRDLATWRRFYMRRTPLGDAEVEEFIKTRLDLHERHAVAHRRHLVALAKAKGAVLASHDDATAEHVGEAVAEGVAVAEFPTTAEAARACHAAGIKVMMGGPNVVRGGSHSGNIAAEELAREGVLDILSSDYVPASLLLAAFELPKRAPATDLPAAIRMVTLVPAEATGLYDRGALAPGKRADLVRVSLTAGTPIARQVWREGRRVS